jgi:hypothetical protein
MFWSMRPTTPTAITDVAIITGTSELARGWLTDTLEQILLGGDPKAAALDIKDWKRRHSGLI